MARVIFIDSRVEAPHVLLQDLEPETQVHHVDAAQDGLAQISTALRNASNLTAIDIVSHGADGMLLLGNTALHQGNLPDHADAWEVVAASLAPTGAIMLYGCELARSDKGVAFVRALADIAGAPVAASRTLVGHRDQGGDWRLEERTAPIAVEPFPSASARDAYAHVLPVVSTIDLSSLNGTTGFKLVGASAGDKLATSVSVAGDLNGDGFDDLIVGANEADPSGSPTGASYVVYGSSSGFSSTIDVGLLNGTDGYRITGIAGGDRSGHSVSNAGDVNGDGFADLIIGSRAASPNNETYAGTSHVVLGSATGFGSNLDLGGLGASSGFALNGATAFDRSGYAVSGAGDVNGDGFADVVIGARDASPGAASAGAAFVVFGSSSPAGVNLSSLDGTNGFRLVGVAAADQTGGSVSSAGDFNGDGLFDLLIGAPNAALAGNNGPGAAFVVFGTATGFAASIDLSALNGGNGVRFSGSGLENAGTSVSHAGDVNGDGIDDIVIGAPDAGQNYNDAGASYVVFGRRQGFSGQIALTTLNGTTGFRIDGAVASEHSGASVSAAGDVNGDGYDDLLIGAPQSTGAAVKAGASYLVYGKASGFAATLQLSALDGSGGVRLLGTSVNDYAGHSVSAAGDVDGDGFDDILVGAVGVDRNNYQTDAGASYLIFGGNFTNAAIVPGTPNADTLTGSAGADTIVAGRGNDTLVGGGGADVFNAGAGNDRIVVASSGFVVADGGSGNDTLVLAGNALMLDVSNNASNRIRDIGRIELSGSFVQTLVIDPLDVIAMSEARNTVRVDAPAVAGGRVLTQATWTAAGAEIFESKQYLLYTSGAATLKLQNNITLAAPVATIELSALDGSNGLRLSGEAADDHAGRAVRGAGDVNGDGFGDFIVGARDADPNGTSSGASYVVFGRSGGFLVGNLNLSALDGNNGFRLAGQNTYDLSGFSVGAAGDVNGDGFDDIIIGAPGADVATTSDGAAYVVFGKASGFAPSLDLATLDGSTGFRIRGESTQDFAGVAVSTAGDVNGDGYDDLLVGEFGSSNYGNQAGAAFVVFGKASGFASNIELDLIRPPDGFKIQGASAFDRAGYSVSNAGDVNGDGYDDVIVGAQNAAPNGASNAGASYVVFGKASGFASRVELSALNGSDGFRLVGAGSDNYAGHSVSGGGDINGDGYDDLVIGARGADAPLFNSGAAYVVYGKASGFAPSIGLGALNGFDGFRIAGAADSDSAGYSASGAGDVNGDGFDDLLVGANGADPNGSGSGATYLVYGKAGGFGASFSLSSLNGVNGTALVGATAGDGTGVSVGAAGDVDADGFDDLLVGASGASPNGSGSGAAYLIFGGFYSGAVTFVGYGGANTPTGTTAAESFVGGASDDVLSGGGGADSFRAGLGADRITVADTGFARVDGGAGNADVLALGGANLRLNLASLTDNRIDGIEIIDLTGTGNNTLKLSARDLLRLSDSSNTLRVDGATGDRVVTHGWDSGSTQQIGNEIYRAYSQGAATLLVDTDIETLNAEPRRGLSALDGSNGFRLSGVAAYDLSGRAVSGAGDINGDGFDDIAIGASGADPHGAYSGASYVVFGAASGFASNLDLSALDGGNGFKLSGVAQGDQSGWSVAGAGDFNGDGFGDLLVGARFADPPFGNAGAAYLVFGKAIGFAATVELSDLDGSNGLRLAGVAQGDYAGFAVDAAGDVNGDGFDDLIIGALGAQPNGSYSGASHVVFGTASALGSNFDLSSLNGSNGFRVAGAAANDRFGVSVSGAGDVNRDGFDDLLIGSNAPSPGADSGAAYVVFGKASGFGATLALSSLVGSNGFKLAGGPADDLAGASVDGAGDVNGDGFADLIVGAPFGLGRAGKSYVVMGKAQGFAATIDLTALNGTDGFQISGVAGSDSAGRSVAGAGDVNGDGFDDLLIGAYAADANGSNSGASYIVLGKAAAFAPNLNLSALDGSNGWRLAGAAAGDFSGISVGSTGDFNGDGFADILIGAENAGPNGIQSGASYVVFGSNISGAATFTGSAAADTVTGTAIDDVFVSGAGADLVTALAGNDAARTGAGNDTVDAGDGNDHVDAGAGNDSLAGGAGFDTLYGGDGDDVLRGGDQGDKLYGGDGDDSFFGGKGLDTIEGGSGNDTLAGLLGNDILIGGPGLDTADYSASDAVSVNLTTSTGGSTVIVAGPGSGLDSLAEIENVTGSGFADAITGDALNNRLLGLAGADTMLGVTGFDFLDGGEGDDNLNGGLNGDTVIGGLGNDILGGGGGMDSLSGGDGSDTITGGLGNDTLTGGAAADRFRYSHVLNASFNVDTITDFTTGVDVIELSASIFSAFAGQIGQTISPGANLLYDSNTGVLAYDPDGAGGAAATTFIILGTGTHPSVLGNDFAIVN